MTLLLPPQAPPENRGPDQSTTPTYYDQPALKPSTWGWLVSGYMAIAGLAGSAQILATAADLAGGDRYSAMVRNGRYLALVGAAAGAPLLIADLHTPRRFYNMLRIFRSTSPMSIGTYVLLGFSGCSAVLAAAQLRRDTGIGPAFMETAARVLELPAAVLGAAMSTYTGALLGATSTPLWAAASRLIPALFGSSAIASAAAALSLAASRKEAAVLDRIELLASASELALIWGLHRQLRINGIETKPALAALLPIAAAPWLRKAAPAVTGPSQRPQAAPPPAPKGRAVIAVAVLASAFLLRHAILRAGNRSAQRPRDYFRLAQPR
jgi:formate-dependent nitrite reductase membrane component NrfD